MVFCAAAVVRDGERKKRDAEEAHSW
jgi:hypothetical protein